MSWRVAKSLLQLRNQIDSLYPQRNKLSDGTIGDALHATTASDHNPWVKDGATGIVTALDITHDPQSGVDIAELTERLRETRDPRIKYVIANGRIFSSNIDPWQWRSYNGSNPHRRHLHISVHSAKTHYDDEREWVLPSKEIQPEKKT